MSSARPIPIVPTILRIIHTILPTIPTESQHGYRPDCDVCQRGRTLSLMDYYQLLRGKEGAELFFYLLLVEMKNWKKCIEYRYQKVDFSHRFISMRLADDSHREQHESLVIELAVALYLYLTYREVVEHLFSDQSLHGVNVDGLLRAAEYEELAVDTFDRLDIDNYSSATRLSGDLVVLAVRLIQMERDRLKLCPEWAKLCLIRDHFGLHEGDFCGHQWKEVIRAKKRLADLLVCCSQQDLTLDVCCRVQFHCRYVLDEVSCMVKQMSSVNFHQYLTWEEPVTPKLLDELIITICRWGLNDFNIGSVGSRIYIFCVEHLNEPALLDRWLSVVFNWKKKKIPDVIGLIRDTKQSLGRCRSSCTSLRSRERSGNFELNGEAEGPDFDDYRYPELLEGPLPLRPRPWWLEKFSRDSDGNRNIPMATAAGNLTSSHVYSGESDPCESSYELKKSSKFCGTASSWWVGKSGDESCSDYRASNDVLSDETNLAILKRQYISDDEMSNFTIIYPSVRLNDDERIILESSDGDRRATNFRKGGLYHCVELKYLPLENSWGCSVAFYKILGPMKVDMKGANRELIKCDDGFSSSGGPERAIRKHIFKQYRKLHLHKIDKYLSDARTHQVTQYHMKNFTRLTYNKYRLSMLDVVTVLAFKNGERNCVIEMMNVEHNMEGVKFIKFTNNRGYKNRKVDTSLAEAFSHFTYDDSEGVLMVTDIQGWVEYTPGKRKFWIILTDPAIHCPGAPRGFFADTNLGEDGFRAFWKDVHPECNEICAELGLKRPTGQ